MGANAQEITGKPADFQLYGSSVPGEWGSREFEVEQEPAVESG
jgi:hypothetical protein